MVLEEIFLIVISLVSESNENAKIELDENLERKTGGKSHNSAKNQFSIVSKAQKSTD